MTLKDQHVTMCFDDTTKTLLCELNLRRQRLQTLLAHSGADAMILTTNVDLLYTTGKIPDGYFYLNTDGFSALFLRRPHAWQGDSIYPIKHPLEIPALLTACGIDHPSHLMLEEDLPHSEYMRLASLFENATLMPSILRTARMIKTPYEQEILRKTGAWHVHAMSAIPSLYQPGMTDSRLEVAIDNHFRSQGHPGMFRKFGHRMEAAMGVLLTGENAAAPSPFDFALGGAGNAFLPISATGVLLREGTTLTVDVSGIYDGYLTDMTRTYAIGYAPAQAYDMHSVALEIQKNFVDNARVGVPCSALYRQSLDIAKKRGFADQFMGCPQQAKFVGHGLGLEINELPVIAPKDHTLLQAGMVIAMEPKFIVPKVGAVGIENTYLLTEQGLALLTQSDDAIIVLPT